MSVGEKTGIVTIIFGGIYGFLSYTMERATVGNPIEPLVFPIALAVIMIICGTALYLGEHKKRLLKEGRSKVKSEKAGFFFGYQEKMITFICIVSLLYGFLFEKIGYVLATTFFMGSLLIVFHGGKKLVMNIVIAAAFSVGIYVVFSRFLFIPLPVMPFFNI